MRVSYARHRDLQLKRLPALFGLLLTFCLFNSSAYAQCTSPPGNDGTKEWFAETGGGSPTGCGTIGQTCSDGSKFAGDTDLYAADVNQSTGSLWSSESVDTGADSTTDGAANQQSIIDNQTLSNYPAFELCANLDRHDHQDWYLPAQDELDVLYTNHVAIGGFLTTHLYWSSTEGAIYNAWAQYFDNGFGGNGAKGSNYAIRCVRRDSGDGATAGTYKFCIDGNWVDLTEDGTLGSCSTEADWDYDAAEKTFKQCDGTDWKKITCAAGGGGSSCVDAGGQEVGGHCWFLGAVDESCDDVCSNNGGLSCDLAGTRDYVGSGGDDANCGAVLDSLGAAGSGNSVTATSYPYGCIVSGSYRLRYTATTTCDAHLNTLARVCACSGGSGGGGSSQVCTFASPTETKLTASDGAFNHAFGSDVAFSPDGTQVLVGTSGNNSAYLLNAVTGAQIRKFTVSPGAAFGRTVAFSADGNQVIIGDHADNSYRGAAYLFNASTGAQIRKFTAADGVANDYFGLGVSFSPDGSQVLIGASGDDSSRGSVYLMNTSTGAQIRKFTAPDRASNDLFGYDDPAIAFSPDGNQVLIGAFGDDDNGDSSGSAYLLNVSTGSLIYKLTPADPAAKDYFGNSVAFSPDGTQLLIGARHYDDPGAVYLFDVSTGSQIRKFTASDGSGSNRFGFDVAFNPDGSQVLIAAYGDNSNAGSVYLFDTATGAEMKKFTSSDSFAGQFVGTSVSFSPNGNKFVTGAGESWSGNGSAYIFESDAGSCSTGGGSCTSLGSCSVEGRMEYDSAGDVMKYCDGADWYPLAAGTP